MFVGRRKELDKLNELYHSPNYEGIIIYGRRRVGKTFLIREWMFDKNGIYFALEQQNSQLLLKKFSELVLSWKPSPYISEFQDFRQAILYVAQEARDESCILVFDEIQYLAVQDKVFLSMLQHLIDHELVETKLKLVLCGSYISFMENEILGEKSPLFGRRTGSFKLEPLRYKEAFELLGCKDDLQGFGAWAVLGGMPLYLKQYDVGMTLKENIIQKILEKGTLLHNEPLFALKQELKDPALYFSIIEGISSGRSKYNEISTFIGTEAGYYLNTLVGLGIVEKITPIGQKPTSRKSIYRMKDPFFAFWFRYVSRRYSLVEMEKQEIMYEHTIKSDIDKFMGHRFEDFCLEYLSLHNGSDRVPIIFTEIGKWWGTDHRTKTEVEFDILAYGVNDDAIIGECKWRNEKVASDILVKLLDRSELIKGSDKYLMVFSKSGFTDGAVRLAEERGIRLVSFRDMVE